MRTRICAVVVLLLGVSAARAEVIDRVLAVVNGHLITLSDVRRVVDLGLANTGRTTDATDVVLSQLIDRRLVLEEVERYAPPEPDQAAIGERMISIQQQLSGPAGLEARLAVLGVDRSWLEQWVRDDLRIHAYIEQRFSGAMEATDDEIENYLREHTGDFVRGGQPLPAGEAQAIARERVTAARRQSLTIDWLEGLRKRAEIARPAPKSVG
jgi:peptidyl-prolyl cis-trans isomerase SurA